MVTELPYFEKIPAQWLGFFARALLVCYRPCLLWIAIQLDGDAGSAAANVLLWGLGFVAISGFRTHKEFYEVTFSRSYLPSRYRMGKAYARYLVDLSSQVLFFCVVAGFSIPLLFWLDMQLTVIVLGVAFGISEKINDEKLRYLQYSLNNQSLLGYACLRLTVVPLTYFSTLAGADVFLVFPLVALLVSLLGVHMQLRDFWRLTNAYTFMSFCRDFVWRRGASVIYKQKIHLLWVFMGMITTYIDRWYLASVEYTHLGSYMFLGQIVAGFIIFHNIVLLAPNKVNLMHKKPSELGIFTAVTLLLSAGLVCVGCLLWAFEISLFGISTALGYAPFIIAGTFISIAPAAERLFWLFSDVQRILLEAVPMCLALCLAFGAWCAGFLSLNTENVIAIIVVYLVIKAFILNIAVEIASLRS